MSRCFPYPPPGYTLSRASNEALIESIKLHKHKEKKAKEQRKKEKRGEKKEKKKEKQEKRKEKKEKETHAKSLAVKTQISGVLLGKHKGEFQQKQREAEVQLLERSNLTEEHGQPVCLHAPSTSSDSTENSHKRKRYSSSPADVSRGHGNVIRIRFSSKKQSVASIPVKEERICTSEKTKKLCDLSLPANDYEICSTPGSIHGRNDNGLTDYSCLASERTINTDGQFSLELRSDRELLCSTSRTDETFAPIRMDPQPVLPDTRITPMHKDELQYKMLIEDWVPPQLQETCTGWDLDWLSQRKNEDKQPEKRQRSVTDGGTCSSSSSLWLRAQYLQEVDIYALPFTVPY